MASETGKLAYDNNRNSTANSPGIANASTVSQSRATGAAPSPLTDSNVGYHDFTVRADINPKLTDTADVKTTKKADKTSAKPGDMITYTITVQNNGPAAAKAPTISDSVPGNVDRPQYTITESDGSAGASGLWADKVTLAKDIPAGGAATVIITGMVKSGGSGDLNNSATTTTNTPNKDGNTNISTGTTSNNDPNQPNTIGSGQNPVVDAADVITKKTSDKVSYKIGDPITYTITVQNNGPAAAKTPTITDNLPTNIDNPQFTVKDSDGVTSSAAAWSGKITLEKDIPSGKSVTITINGTVKAAGGSPDLNNSAITTTNTPNKFGRPNKTTGTTANSDPTKPNTAGSGQNPSIYTADVSTDKFADKKSYKPGDTIIYTILISNEGPATAIAPVVSDTLPPQIENPQFNVDGGTISPWNGSITLSDLPAGTLSTIKIFGKVKAGATGSLANSATTHTNTPNENGDDNTTVGKTSDDPQNGDPFISSIADLETTVAVDNPTPKPGDSLTYTVTTKNNGPSAAESPAVSYTPPSNLTNVEYSADGGKTWSPWTGTAARPNIPNGGSDKLLIRGKIPADNTSPVTSTITTTSKTDDPNSGNNTITISTSVKPTADLATAVTVDNPTPKPGDSLTYTVTTKNNGPSEAESPAVRYTPPSNLTNVEYSADGGKTWSPWTGTASRPNIPNGGSFQILIRGKIPADNTSPVISTITTTSKIDDPNTDNNTSTISTTITPTADLATAVTVDNPTPKPGDSLTYTVTTKNNGPSTAESPAVSYTPPSNLTNVEYSADGSKTWSPWTGTAARPNIPNGGSFQLLIRGKIPADNTSPVTSTINTTSKTDDPNTGNNTITITTSVKPTADLATAVTVDNPTPKPGDSLTYTVIIKNNGPSTAESPAVSYTPPSNLTNVEYSADGGKSWSPWTGTASRPNIPNGGSDKLLIRGKIPADNTSPVTSTITTSSKTDDPNSGNNTTTISTPVTPTAPVIPTADLATAVTVDNPTPKPGDSLTYTVIIKNNGPSTAESPAVSYTSPSNLSNVEYSADGGKSWSPWTGTTTRPNIPNGGSNQLLIRGKIPADNTSPVISTITTTSKTDDPNSGNNTVTTNTPMIFTTANLVTTVTVDNDEPSLGDVITYTVNVRNSGPATATSPEVSYRPPRGLTNVEYSNDSGKTWSPWSGSTTLSDIPNGTIYKILIRGKIDGDSTNLSTIITATPKNPDAHPGDNTATITTPVKPVTPENPKSDLATSLTVDKPAPKPGEKVTISVSLKNNGPATAKAPVVSYQPPRGLRNAEYSPDAGKTWKPWSGSATLTDIPNGATSQMLIRGDVDGVTSGTVSNTITATPSNPDPNPGNNTGTIVFNITPPAPAKVCVVSLYDTNCCPLGSIKTECGKIISPPPAPVRAGCTFVGWYCDRGLRRSWNYNNHVRCDMDLYAKFVPKCNWYQMCSR